jgi:hypothetical protein
MTVLQVEATRLGAANNAPDEDRESRLSRISAPRAPWTAPATTKEEIPT